MNSNPEKIYNLKDLDYLIREKPKIGLLGASFNPAHIGHLKISLDALKYFNLDLVIWLVALQNPLKNDYESDIFKRAENAAKILSDSKICVSSAEYDLKVKYSYQIIKYLTDRYKNTEFFWIMGADCLIHFGSWENSNLIQDLCRVVVYDRPGYSKLLTDKETLTNHEGNKLILRKGPMINISSSEIRCANDQRYERT